MLTVPASQAAARPTWVPLPKPTEKTHKYRCVQQEPRLVLVRGRLPTRLSAAPWWLIRLAATSELAQCGAAACARTLPRRARPRSVLRHR